MIDLFYFEFANLIIIVYFAINMVGFDVSVIFC